VPGTGCWSSQRSKHNNLGWCLVGGGLVKSSQFKAPQSGKHSADCCRGPADGILFLDHHNGAHQRQLGQAEQCAHACSGAAPCCCCPCFCPLLPAACCLLLRLLPAEHLTQVMLTNSVVIKEESDWIEYYYR
jgi:hypothetical protein